MLKQNVCGQYIKNGDFSTGDFSDWTVSATMGMPVATGGYAELPTDSNISQKIELLAGQDVLLSYDLTLVNSATGGAVVKSSPSGTQLYWNYASGPVTDALITVPDGDTEITVEFYCGQGGEVHVDNVTLFNATPELVKNGSFDDNTFTGWDTAGTSGYAPHVDNQVAVLPNNARIMQNIIVTGGCNVSLSYDMTTLYSATPSATITALSTQHIIYDDYTGGNVRDVIIQIPDGEDKVQIKFDCVIGGEVHVDNVSMTYI